MALNFGKRNKGGRISARLRSRLAMVVSALALITGSVLALGPQAQAALPSNCGYDADGNGWVCVTITSSTSNSTFRTAWSDTLINKTNRAANFTCSSTTSTTYTEKISTTISAEAGIVFAKVDSAVTVDLQHSRDSGKTTSGSISVPANTTTRCDRGVYTHSYTGNVQHVRCSSSACISSNGTFSLYAPSTAAWRFTDL